MPRSRAEQVSGAWEGQARSEADQGVRGSKEKPGKIRHRKKGRVWEIEPPMKENRAAGASPLAPVLSPAQTSSQGPDGWPGRLGGCVLWPHPCQCCQGP